MKQKVQNYVGQLVRLNARVFQRIKRQAQQQGMALENSFLVAQVSLKMKKLICYGANFRVVVDISDVVFV